jgi:Cu-Zn family superoxide dismutase
VGDLGNITADKNGICEMQLIDSQIKLKGNKYNILGRGLIIHEDPDDLGQGTNEASKINGNAGKRIACAVIGYASNCNKPTTK